MIKELKKLLDPLKRRVDNMVARAVVSLINDSTGLQTLQVKILKGEVRELERFQNYGFTSRPLAGAEALVVFVGGDRSHGVAVAVDDRRHRIKDLEPGESVMHNDQGDYVIIKKNREIHILSGAKVYVESPEVVVKATTSVTLDTPQVFCTGGLKVTGEIEGEGGLKVEGDFTNNDVNVGSTHPHTGVSSGSQQSGGPLP
jgi:phage baseplate assembly protein V